MKKRMSEIRDLENEYGLMLFGMGLSYLRYQTDDRYNFK
jgi:hypothetical protein